ncbi:DUF4149 domain-containing protein [Hydrogenophaga pseudoflava]|uniref:DUF4149 domain-containing protein n=1 Tax=Hydrogenophaga pseudoflava TaxID=47421 RepID=UPI0027E49296|nr:DUF4149 domain-containing protein [Hydrogenophaga pseudoflava]MDQ7746526.1 DUF4149 domain-containing protein [Hydrogenophaga pseudoflava]
MPLHRLSVLIAALWWGGITGLSFVAVPTLFAKLGSPMTAGPVAAQLFSFQCWIGLVLGVGLMLVLRRQRASLSPEGSEQGLSHLRALTWTMALVVLAVLLAMVQEFGVARKIVTARATGGDLRLWHSLGFVLVLGQWLCAGGVLWRLAGPQPRVTQA